MSSSSSFKWKPRSSNESKEDKFESWIIDSCKKVKCPIDYSRFVITEKSRHMALLPYQVKSVSEFFENVFVFPYQVHKIIDATAHIGTDLVNLLRIYSQAEAIAIEKDTNTFNKLKKNVLAFGLGDRVTLVNESAVEFFKTNEEKVDLIYLDPPWGTLKPNEINLDGLLIEQLVELIEPQTQAIVVKLPPRYDLTELESMYETSSKTILSPTGKPLFSLVMIVTNGVQDYQDIQDELSLEKQLNIQDTSHSEILKEDS